MKVDAQSVMQINAWYSQLTDLEKTNANGHIQLSQSDKPSTEKLLTERKIVNLTVDSNTVDKQTNVQMRNTLLTTLKSGFGIDENDIGFQTIKERLVGKQGETKNEFLTPLEARRIIDSARTLKKDHVESLLNTAMSQCIHADDNVKFLLAKTIKDCASHPDVINFLQTYGEGKRDTTILARLCNLASEYCKEELKTLHYARGYFIGFAGDDKAEALTDDMYTIGVQKESESRQKYDNGFKWGKKERGTQQETDKVINQFGAQLKEINELKLPDENQDVKPKFNKPFELGQDVTDNEKKMEALKQYFSDQQAALTELFKVSAKKVKKDIGVESTNDLKAEQIKELKQSSLFSKISNDFKTELRGVPNFKDNLKNMFKELLKINWGDIQQKQEDKTEPTDGKAKAGFDSDQKVMVKNWLFNKYYESLPLGPDNFFHKDDLDKLVDLLDKLPLQDLRKGVLQLAQKQAEPEKKGAGCDEKQNLTDAMDNTKIFCDLLMEAVLEAKKGGLENNGLKDIKGNSNVENKGGDDEKDLNVFLGTELNTGTDTCASDVGVVSGKGEFDGKKCSYTTVNNNGTGANCFFFAVLNQIEKGMNVENAVALREKTVQYAQNMLGNIQDYAGVTISNNKLMIGTSGGWINAEFLKRDMENKEFTEGVKVKDSETKNYAQADQIFGAVVASLLKRPVQIIGMVNNEMSLSQNYDIDLKTGNKLTGTPIRLHLSATGNIGEHTAGHFQSIKIQQEVPKEDPNVKGKQNDAEGQKTNENKSENENENTTTTTTTTTTKATTNKTDNKQPGNNAKPPENFAEVFTGKPIQGFDPSKMNSKSVRDVADEYLKSQKNIKNVLGEDFSTLVSFYDDAKIDETPIAHLANGKQGAVALQNLIHIINSLEVKFGNVDATTYKNDELKQIKEMSGGDPAKFVAELCNKHEIQYITPEDMVKQIQSLPKQ